MLSNDFELLNNDFTINLGKRLDATEEEAAAVSLVGSGTIWSELGFRG